MSLRLRLALFLVAVFCGGEWLLVRTVLGEVKPLPGFGFVDEVHLVLLR